MIESATPKSTPPPAWGPHERQTLPRDLIEDASRRLRFAAVLVVGVSVAVQVFNELTRAWPFGPDRAVALRRARRTEPRGEVDTGAPARMWDVNRPVPDTGGPSPAGAAGPVAGTLEIRTPETGRTGPSRS